MQRGVPKQFAMPIKMAVAILMSGSLAACGKFDSTEKLIADAQSYQKKGEDKAAIIQAKNALQKDPNNTEARLLLAKLYSDVGDAQSAEKEARKAIELGMPPPKAVPLLAASLLMQGKSQKALDELKALGDAVTDPEVLVVRGNAYFAQGKMDAAKESYESARKTSPDYPSALIGLAKIALTERDTTAATRLADRAVEVHPQNPDVWFFKGDLLRIQGQVEPALAAYDKLLSLKPGNAVAHIVKADVEIGAKKFEAARADIDAAKKASLNGMSVLYTQAYLDYAQGNYSAALESVQQVLRVAPEHMPSLLLVGAVELALGSSQQAEQHLRKYLDKNPGNLQASKLLIAALLKNDQAERAMGLANSALGKAPEDPQLLALAGEAYMKLKNFNKATEYFEKASALAPKTAPLRTALGMSRLAQGEEQRAISDLEVATQLDATSNAGITLIMTHVRLKNFDKALAVANTLEKDQPRNPLVPQLRGGIHLEMKDIKAARVDFEKALSLDQTYVPAAQSLARLDLQEKKPELARKRFESVLEKDKKNALAMTALAELASSQGNQQETTKWLERAAKENSDDPRPSMLLAAHYLRLGEQEKALVLAQNLQTLYPTRKEVLETLANVQAATKNLPAALETYKKLSVLMPESGEPYLKMASLHVASGNESAAAESLKKALSLQPDYLDAQLAQSGLDIKAKRYDAALKIARDIQKQRGQSPAGFVLEGDIYKVQNQPAQAVKAFEQAFSLNKASPILVKLHEAMKASGKGNEAEARLAAWIKENPNDIFVRMYAGADSLMNHRTEDAIVHYQAVLKVNPKNAIALNNIALAYHENRDPQALKFAEEAAALAPKAPAVLDTFGWILVENNNVAKGLPLLQQAVALDTNSDEIQLHYALGLIKSGNKAKAREELEKLLARSPGSTKAPEAQRLLKTL